MWGVGMMFNENPRPLLFVFDEGQKPKMTTMFMMKTVDMIFINDQLKVVDIQKAKPFRLYFKTDKDAKMVLEVPEGMGEHFKIGDKVKLEI